MIDSLWQDVRYATRSLGRTPAFTRARSKGRFCVLAILLACIGLDGTTATALASGYLPARRAAQLDSTVALRAE